MFNGKTENAKFTWDNAELFLDDFRLYNLTTPTLISYKVTLAKWQKSPAGVIKINVDAACNNDEVGIGVLTRDHEGFVLGGRMHYSSKTTHCTWAEAEAE